MSNKKFRMMKLNLSCCLFQSSIFCGLLLNFYEALLAADGCEEVFG